MTHDIDQLARDWWLAVTSAPDDAALQSRFDAWLAEDDRHRLAYLDVLMADNAAAAALANLPEPIDDVQDAPSLRQPRPSRRGWLYGFAAVPLMALLVLVSPKLAGPLQDLRADHATGAGEQRTVTLADGSEVVLGPHTAIRVTFDATSRQVDLLRGVIDTTVGDDGTHAAGSRPFRVTHEGFLIRDIGTRFVVDEAGDGVRVSVSEGVVDISRAGYPNLHRLEAGERMQWDHNGAKRLPAQQSPPSVEPGVLVLDHADAMQALDAFARTTGTSIRVIGDLPDHHFSAALPIRDAPMQQAARDRIFAEFGLDVRLEALGVVWVAARAH